jgi:hypothetical protein
MTEILLGILVLLALLNIMIGLRKRAVVDISPQMKELETSLVRF